MPVIFKVYNDDIIKYTDALTYMTKYAFPVVVRQTLSKAAFDVKGVTMPEQFSANFIERKPTFKKATSTVNPAVGFNVNGMKAEVGFLPPTNIKESGHATKDLEDQEYGGAINKRAFIATRGGRTNKGNVQGSLTMAEIKSKIVDANKDEWGKNSGEKFIRTAIKAGVGGYVIGTGKNSKGSRALLMIKAIKRVAKTEKHEGNNVYSKGDTVIKTKEIYTVKKHRKAHVKATHFMEKAAEATTKKMNDIYIVESEKMFEKVRLRMKNKALKF